MGWTPSVGNTAALRVSMFSLATGPTGCSITRGLFAMGSLVAGCVVSFDEAMPRGGLLWKMEGLKKLLLRYRRDEAPLKTY